MTDDPLAHVTMPTETLAERITADGQAFAAGYHEGQAAAHRTASDALLAEAVALSRAAVEVGASHLAAVAAGLLSAAAMLRTMADVCEGRQDTPELRQANARQVTEEWEKKCHGK